MITAHEAPISLSRVLKTLRVEFQMTKFVRFVKDESGATAIEYGLIAAAMGLALVTAMPILATSITGKFSSLAVHITSGK
jgi:pilus assembly protein Flp/PilA